MVKLYYGNDTEEGTFWENNLYYDYLLIIKIENFQFKIFFIKFDRDFFNNNIKFVKLFN